MYMQCMLIQNNFRDSFPRTVIGFELAVILLNTEDLELVAIVSSSSSQNKSVNFGVTEIPQFLKMLKDVQY